MAQDFDAAAFKEDRASGANAAAARLCGRVRTFRAGVVWRTAAELAALPSDGDVGFEASAELIVGAGTK